jgi:hypothetical protein
MKRLLPVLSAVFLPQTNLFAWKNGELLMWMDSDRGRAIGPIVKKFENDPGIKVSAELG